MRTDKYHQLNEVHLLQRIWRSELELALQQVTFWEELLGSLDENLDANKTTFDDTWQMELGQLHHFRRLIKRLQEDLQSLDEQVALGVRTDHVLDKETRLNQQYLREEMDSFHADFRTFKNGVRRYIAAEPAF
ncbi:hypothetical protein [Spirosoma sp. KNUC1025]|uniref:hypothetical protein n=1 Tax=Spirosoma sp. KNUC1025 TaxID=2894082 RepID=UPI003866B485|nr:hypothetical protein LN737_13945 [Spirosoma sp. KNUC1025]